MDLQLRPRILGLRLLLLGVAHDADGFGQVAGAELNDEEAAETKGAETGLERTPWRETGWIFRNGDCILIERQGNETRAQVQVL